MVSVPVPVPFKHCLNKALNLVELYLIVFFRFFLNTVTLLQLCVVDGSRKQYNVRKIWNVHRDHCGLLRGQITSIPDRRFVFEIFISTTFAKIHSVLLTMSSVTTSIQL